MQDRFYVGNKGLYYRNPYYRAAKNQLSGSLVRGISVTRFDGRDYYTKNLVYFLYHGEWSDYELTNYDGDPENNGVLNLLEEGENLIWNELGFDVCNTALWSDEAFAYDESNTYNTFFRVKPYEVLNELAENDAIGTVYTTKNSPTLNDYMCTTTLNNVLEDGMDVDEALQDAQDYLDFECE